jgi:hypothetical protein
MLIDACARASLATARYVLAQVDIRRLPVARRMGRACETHHFYKPQLMGIAEFYQRARIRATRWLRVDPCQTARSVEQMMAVSD